MPEWMAWADLAIAAGGSTNWELTFMGLPSVIITVAENQTAIAQQLGKMEITISLGWHQKLTVKQLTTAISDLLSAQQKRQQMSEKGKQLVDGLGSQRVVEIISQDSTARSLTLGQKLGKMGIILSKRKYQ